MLFKNCCDNPHTVVERKHGEPCSALRETNAVAGETRVPAGMIDSHVVQLQQPWLHRYVIARLQTHSDIATTTRLTATKLLYNSEQQCQRKPESAPSPPPPPLRRAGIFPQFSDEVTILLVVTFQQVLLYTVNHKNVTFYF